MFSVVKEILQLLVSLELVNQFSRGVLTDRTDYATESEYICCLPFYMHYIWKKKPMTDFGEVTS